MTVSSFEHSELRVFHTSFHFSTPSVILKTAVESFGPPVILKTAVVSFGLKDLVAAWRWED